MSGILISGKINAVIPTETNILTCIGTKAVEKNDFVLTPGRYVGYANAEDDGVLFEEKFKSLKSELIKLEEEGSRLSKQIKSNLKNIHD